MILIILLEFLQIISNFNSNLFYYTHPFLVNILNLSDESFQKDPNWVNKILIFSIFIKKLNFIKLFRFF